MSNELPSRSESKVLDEDHNNDPKITLLSNVDLKAESKAADGEDADGDDSKPRTQETAELSTSKAYVVDWANSNNRIVSVNNRDVVRFFRSMSAKGRVRCRDLKTLKMQFIIDSGGSASMISERCWRKCGGQADDLDRSETVRFHNASGEDMPVLGRAQIPIIFNEVEFRSYAYVVKDLAPDMILGVDWLHTLGAKINFADNSLEIPGIRKIAVDVGFNKEQGRGQLLVSKSFIIPPRATATCVLELKNKAETLPEQLIVRAGDDDPKHLHMATCIVTPRDAKMLGQVVNTSSQPITVLAGTVMGKTEDWEGKPQHTVYQHQMVSDREPVMSNAQRKWSDGVETMKGRLEAHATQERMELLPADQLESAIRAATDHLQSHEVEQILNVAYKYRRIFVTGQTAMPTRAKDVIGRLQVNGEPIASAPYRYTPTKQQAINEQVQALLDQDVIQATLSPWAAPVVIVEKPGQPGKWRLCIDYRKLNHIIEPTVWPMPRIEACLNKLRQAKYITVVDLAWGFWAIPLDEESRPKTAFVTEDGHYEWKRLPMGLQSSPQIFQKSMDLLLADVKGLYAMCYIDDLIIYSDTFPEHKQHLDDVLRRLHQANRSVRLEKIQWARPRVQFLGFDVGEGRVRPVTKKISPILGLAQPTSTSGLRSFLGAAGVYRRFIKGFAIIAEPLFDLLKKDADLQLEWSSSARYQEAFDELKTALAAAPELTIPDSSRTCDLIVENSVHGIGASLVQKSEGLHHPIGFVSRRLEPEERTLSAVERELRAVQLGMKKFNQYLYPGQATIYTRESNLAWAMDPFNVHDRSKVISLNISVMNPIIKSAKGAREKASHLFSYNDPERDRKVAAEQKRKEQTRQKQIQLEEIPSDFILQEGAHVLSFDGGFRWSSKKGGAGWALWTIEQGKWKAVAAGLSNDFSGTTTVNIQEFVALINGLYAVKKRGIVQPIVVGDSKLVIGLMQRKLKAQAENMNKLAQEAQKLLASTRIKNVWHVRREYNGTADTLVNMAMELDAQIDDLELTGEETEKQLHVRNRLPEKLSTRESALAATVGPKKITCNPMTTIQPFYESDTMEPVVYQKHERLQRRLSQGQHKTPWMKELIEWFKYGKAPDGEQEIMQQRAAHFALHNGLLWYREPITNAQKWLWRLVVPESMREDILWTCHDDPMAGHLKGVRFWDRVSHRYYWPNMAADVQHYDRTCKACASGKTSKNKTRAPLQPQFKIIGQPFQSVAVDYITDLPVTAKGNRHLLVFVDVFSKWPEVVPVPDLTSRTFVDAFMKTIITRHGCPEMLVSDQGKQFVGELAKAIYERLDIKKNNTTAYHPMSNGTCERFNQTLIEGLRVVINNAQDNWDETLDGFLMAYRTSTHSTTKLSPFQVVYGRPAKVPADQFLENYNGDHLKPLDVREYYRDTVGKLHETRQVVREKMTEAFKRNKAYYDRRSKDVPLYEKGDKVWMWWEATTPGTKQKLWNRWYGPFEIVRQMSETTYVVGLPAGRHIADHIHVNRLHRFVDRAEWPAPLERDMEIGLKPELSPEDLQEVHLAGEKRYSQRVLQERVRITSSGTRRRELLLKLTDLESQTSSEMWVDQQKFTADGLLWRFREKQREQERLLKVRGNGPEALPQLSFQAKLVHCEKARALGGMSQFENSENGQLALSQGLARESDIVFK